MSEDIQKEREILKIIRRKAPGTVAIFDCKGFYRCYEEDVKIITNEILMSNVGVQYEQIDENAITFHNLNNAQYIRVLRDLLLFLRFRVELYEECAKENENSPVRFILKAKGILGNLVDFEETLAECVEMNEMSTIGCVRLLDDDSQENKLALVSANSQDLRIVVAQLTDTANFTELEQAIVSIQPRECIVLNGKMASNRFKKLEMALNRTNIEKRILDEQYNDGMVDDHKSDVQKLLHKKFLDIQLPPVIWQTLHTLLSQMNLLNDRQYEGAFFLTQFGTTGQMYISNAVVQALDIFEIDTEIDSPTLALPNSSSTLYEHLNRCRSQPGKRLIRDWLRRPLFSHRQIEERLNVVETLCNCPIIRQSLHEDLLRRVPDIRQITRKLVQKKATLQDCHRLYQMVLLLRNIENCLAKINEDEDLDAKLFNSVKELILEPIQHSIMEFERFVKLIEGAIDYEYLEESGKYRIKPDLDDELMEISAQMRELDGEAEKLLPSLVDRIGCEVKLESNSELGFFFRIPNKFESNLNRIPDAKIVDSTKAGGVRFQTMRQERLNDEYQILSKQYEEGQAELQQMVIETCAGYAPALHSLAERIGTIDVLTAFAIVAVSSPFSYVRPKILDKDSAIIDLRNCRHPMIENLAGMQFIPNNVTMGQNAECKRFMVLTGANMGGKSTYLKAAALTILLGQIGCFVPCESATFSMVDGIYTRVGAGDFQCKGISTFMAEMMDCGTILEKATSNSLILVDELGRGTSTYDGFGLAWAIAEDIIERIDCFTLFATHFHEISNLEAKYPNKVKNFKMDTLIANGQLTILYQIVPGVADRSFGLNIAEMVGIPKEIIQDAEVYLHKLETGDLADEEDNNDENILIST